MAAEAAAEHGAEHHGGGGIEIGQHWTQTVPGWGSFHADTVLYAGIVMVLLLLVFAAMATAFNKVPDQQSGHTGTVLEGIVDFVQGFIHDFIGPNSAPYLWFIGSIFVFVLACNWLALLPWKAWEMWAGAPLAHAFGAPHPLVYEAPTRTST
jgi:F0F1-type ATP synthase membrane subunit a